MVLLVFAVLPLSSPPARCPSLTQARAIQLAAGWCSCQRGSDCPFPVILHLGHCLSGQPSCLSTSGQPG